MGRHRRDFGTIANRLARDSTLPHAAFRLYALLAGHANEYGECMPGTERLAGYMGISERAVEKQMAVLVERGIVVRKRRFNNSTVTVLCDMSSNEPEPEVRERIAVEPEPEVRVVGEPEVRVVGEPEVRGNKTSRTRPVEQTSLALAGEVVVPQQQSKSSSNGDGFDRFWALYPRKVAKAAARKAWDKAVKSVPAAEIIAGLERTRDQLVANASEAKHIPHAATWLNASRWEDEADPVMPANGSISRHMREWFDADGELIMGDRPAVTESEGSWYDESND